MNLLEESSVGEYKRYHMKGTGGEEAFRAVVEQSPSGIYLLSSEGMIIEWNAALENITELEKNEVLGWSLMDVMCGLLPEKIKNQEQFNRVHMGTLAYIHEGVIPSHGTSVVDKIECRSGAVKYVEITLIRVRLQDGILTGGFVQDITAKKKSEAAMKRSLDEMTMLRSIANLGALADDVETFLCDTHKIILDSIGATACYYRTDGEDGSNDFHMICTQEGYIKGEMFSNIIIDKMMSSRRAQITNFTAEDEYITICENVISVLTAPFIQNDRIIGLLYFERNEGPVFSAEDAMCLDAVAGQLSTAIAKVMLMRRLKDSVSDRTYQLSTLYDVLDIANRSNKLSSITNQSLHKVLDVLNCTCGALFLINEEDRYELETSININSDILGKLLDHLNQEDGLPEENYKQPIPLQSSYFTVLDINEAEKFSFIPFRALQDEMGGIVIPLNAILNMPYDDEALLVSISDQIGATIETFRLRKKSEGIAVREERERLSQELHDSVTQLLYSLTLFAKTGYEFALKEDYDNTLSRLDNISSISLQALKEMRLMIYELRPHILEQDGLEEAIHRRLEAVERQLNITSSVCFDGPKLPPEIENTMYFIVMEALNNVLKHANASQVSIVLHTTEKSLELRIEDNGVGFNIGSEKRGMGFTNIMSAVDKIDGQLDIVSSLGQGTGIQVNVTFR